MDSKGWLDHQDIRGKIVMTENLAGDFREDVPCGYCVQTRLAVPDRQKAARSASRRFGLVASSTTCLMDGRGVSGLDRRLYHARLAEDGGSMPRP